MLHTLFSRYVGFPLFFVAKQRRNRKNNAIPLILKRKVDAENKSYEEITRFQLARLRGLLIHARDNVPYYQSIFSKIRWAPEDIENLQQLEDIPPLTKGIIQEQAERLRAANIHPKLVYKNSTGGSTGAPISFYQDRFYKDEQLAAAYMSDMAAGWRIGATTAVLWGSDRDVGYARRWQGRVENWMLNRHIYNTFDMSQDNMARFHRSMKKKRPDVIVAYASSAYWYAKYLKENEISPDYPQKSIITSAEVLHDYMREELEEVFNVPVFNRYGSRETGILAYECEAHCGLHTNMQDVVLECVGENVYEQPGELLVTQLNNYAMPFIRYRIGDMAIMSNMQCTCGRSAPLIKNVVGRITDTITTPAGDLIHGEYFTHLFYGVEGVKKFQFVQEKIDYFVVNIVPTHSFDKNFLDALKSKLAKVLGDEGTIEFRLVKEIPLTRSGKHLFTISKVPVKFGVRDAK